MGRLEYEDWEQRWNQLYDKCYKKGYGSLSSDERMWFNVRGVIDAINNGGTISYYYNHGADDLDDTLEDLEKIDAIEMIDILNKINELFPNGKPSTDIDERNEVISSWEDGQYDDLLEALNERFYDKLEEELEMKLDEVVKRLISN